MLVCVKSLYKLKGEVMASEIIEGGGFKIQPLVEGDETGESVSVFHCEMQPGVTTPAPHSHDGFDETVYCLAGKINFVLDGKPRLMESGDLIHVPRGVVHGFAVAGEEPAKLLAISTPGIFYAAYFREMAEILAAAAGGPPDRAAIAEVMKRHGLTPAVPARA